MNSPEDSAVRELGMFTVNVLQGMLDMHDSASELVRYSFQSRTLKDVVRRGTENPELIEQIKDKLNDLVEYLNEEIVNYAGGATEFGMENRLFTELMKRIHLMYEVWLAMSVNENYQKYDLTKHVDATKDAVQKTFEICENFPRWKELSQAHREFFLEQREQQSGEVTVEPTMFAREDGVVTSLAYQQALSDEDAKKKQFVAKTEKVLNNYRAKNPDFKTMRELIGMKTNFCLDGIHTETLINVFVSVWDLAIEEEKEKYLFISLFKKVFMLMTDKKRNDLAGKLFDKYRTDGNDVLPCLENFIENFQAGLTAALNQLPLDSAVLSNNTNIAVFEKAKQEIVWFLLVSPGTTLQQLLMMCVDNKGYIPLVMRICRCLPTLFDRSVHVTPLPHEKGEKNLLLITILHRVFMIGRTTWTSASQWENAGSMASSFAKNRKRKEGQSETPEDKAVIDPFFLVQFALEELMIEQRKPQKAVETVVLILKRILANNNNARMTSTFRFASGFDDTGDHVVATPYIMHLMFELLVEFDGKSPEVTEGAREILKSIGGRLQNEKVLIDENTIYSLSGDFNGAPWWIKYSIFSWFASSLQNPKRQVPSGVYISLPETQKDDFEQIKSEGETTVSEDYLKSLFELGLFDVDLAVDLLRRGTEIKFGGSDVIEKIALALVDSFGKKLAKRNGGRDIGRLIAEMLRIFDPIRELVALQTYSSNYFESIKKIEHILVIYKAARIAREKEMGAVRTGNDQTPQAAYDEILSAKEVAEQLMDIFCETAKTHVEKESSEVKEHREKANTIIFSPGRTPEQWEAMRELHGREQTLVLQLTMLYLEASHFAAFYQAAPVKLQQLMHVTLDRQFDSQKWVTKKVMDDALTESRKTEVVYAFVENPPVVQPRELEKEVVQPVKQSELLPPKQPARQEKENVSAENATFGMSGGDRYARTTQNQHHGEGYRGPNNHRKYHAEHDRPTSSRGPPGGQFRTKKHWDPVLDTQNLPPRDREVVYLKSKYSPRPNNRDYHHSRRSYESEKLYYEDRAKSPMKSSDDVRRSGDVRKYSESKDYDSWDCPSRRYPSESDYSLDDLDNRHIDKTVRAVHQFARRDSFSSRPGTSSCSPPPQQQGGPEVKGHKKRTGFESRAHNGFSSRKAATAFGKHPQRPAYVGPHDFEQEEDGKKRLRSGQADREQLAAAMGFNERVADPTHQRPRRGGHH